MADHWRTIPGFVRIGTTGKTRGINGELKLYLDDGFEQSALSAEFLFVQVNGNLVPLFVEEIREVQDVLVKFEGVDDPGQASYWSSMPVFLPADEIVQEAEEKETSLLTYAHLKGYTMQDVSLGEIGTIEDVREFPQQEMAVLQYQNREVLIPLHASFIAEINDEKRVVLMDLPEGLLEL